MNLFVKYTALFFAICLICSCAPPAGRINPNDPLSASYVGTNSTNIIQATIATYTVTYSGNGNTSGTAPSDTNKYTNGQTVTVLAPATLARSTYGFTGWNTASDGSGTSRPSGATFSMGTANASLYAQWTTWNPNGSNWTLATNAAAFSARWDHGSVVFILTHPDFAGSGMSGKR